MRSIWESLQEVPVPFPSIWQRVSRSKKFTDRSHQKKDNDSEGKRGKSMRITDLLDVRSISLDSAPKSKSEALDQAVELMARKR